MPRPRQTAFGNANDGVAAMPGDSLWTTKDGGKTWSILDIGKDVVGVRALGNDASFELVTRNERGIDATRGLQWDTGKPIVEPRDATGEPPTVRWARRGIDPLAAAILEGVPLADGTVLVARNGLLGRVDLDSGAVVEDISLGERDGHYWVGRAGTELWASWTDPWTSSTRQPESVWRVKTSPALAVEPPSTHESIDVPLQHLAGGTADGWLRLDAGMMFRTSDASWHAHPVPDDLAELTVTLDDGRLMYFRRKPTLALALVGRDGRIDTIATPFDSKLAPKPARPRRPQRDAGDDDDDDGDDAVETVPSGEDDDDDGTVPGGGETKILALDGAAQTARAVLLPAGAAMPELWTFDLRTSKAERGTMTGLVPCDARRSCAWQVWLAGARGIAARAQGDDMGEVALWLSDDGGSNWHHLPASDGMVREINARAEGRATRMGGLFGGVLLDGWSDKPEGRIAVVHEAAVDIDDEDDDDELRAAKRQLRVSCSKPKWRVTRAQAARDRASLKG
ncbi:MAG: hypothetical protein EXR75_17235, partial [Myxococcales bacterium]|nr:hypothetical protein [Myxococcales bacterium]